MDASDRPRQAAPAPGSGAAPSADSSSGATGSAATSSGAAGSAGSSSASSVPPAPTVQVRPARPEDAPSIAALAAELNAHQGDPSDQFPAEVVQRDGFGPRPKFHVLVAEHQGQVVGYAMLLPAYETGWGSDGLYMSDLHVGHGHRRLGIGRALMVACAQEVRRQGKGYLWWASRAWNEPAQAFYRALGAYEEPIFAHSLDAEGVERLARGENASG